MQAIYLFYTSRSLDLQPGGFISRDWPATKGSFVELSQRGTDF